MTVNELGQLGVTKLYTSRERRLRLLALFLIALGAAGSFVAGMAVVSLLTGNGAQWPAVTFRPLMAGEGALVDPTGQSTTHFQFPVELTWPPVSIGWSIATGLVPFVVWVRYLVLPLLRRFEGNARHRGLATAQQVQKRYGPHAVRRAGRYTLPGSTFVRRLMMRTSGLGIHIGRAITPKKGGPLWVNLEQRVRIIARPGWGKTLRLLVPIIRQLQGPALVSSTEPDIFRSTVKARQFRKPALRFPFRARVQEYPIGVVDCSSAGHRIAAGYPTIQWNPIPGCEDFVVATRRAEALVKGVDTAGGSIADTTSRWFEDGAAKILAAWLHAAALNPSIEIEDLAEWLAKSTYTEPESILKDRATDPAALMGMRKYLDPKGGRTTANLETSVSKALYSLTSVEGRAVCGRRGDSQFDMRALIRASGTMYLLGEPARMTVVRPLLSLLASEMFVAAEDVARASNGRSPAFYGVLDELRSGVRVASLPDIASEKRKFRIHYVYACTNGGDEEALYGEADAARLKAAAGTSIYGGIDELSAKDITSRAGQTQVVTASRGSEGHRSEGLQQFDTLTAADMQQLADGESVIVGRDLLPFLAFTPATYERRAMKRAIKREKR